MPTMLIFFIFLILILILFGSVKLILFMEKKKAGEITLITTQKEIEHEKAKLDTENEEIEREKERVEKLIKLSLKLEKEKEELKKSIYEQQKMGKAAQKISDSLKAELIEIEKLREQSTKPYPNLSARGRLVWRNPELGGYDCYYNKDDTNPFSKNLVHIYVAEKWIYNKDKSYYKLPFKSYQVHHIDDDKYNHRINNLILLTPEQHNKVTKIIKNNEAQGLGAIKKAGIEIPSHLRNNLNQL